MYWSQDTGYDVTRTSTAEGGIVTLFGVTPGVVDVTIRAGDVTYRSWPVMVRAGAWTHSFRHP